METFWLPPTMSRPVEGFGWALGPGAAGLADAWLSPVLTKRGVPTCPSV